MTMQPMSGAVHQIIYGKRTLLTQLFFFIDIIYCNSVAEQYFRPVVTQLSRKKLNTFVDARGKKTFWDKKDKIMLIVLSKNKP